MRNGFWNCGENASWVLAESNNWERPHGYLNGKPTIDKYFELSQKIPFWDEVENSYDVSKERIKESNYYMDLKIKRLKPSLWITHLMQKGIIFKWMDWFLLNWQEIILCILISYLENLFNIFKIWHMRCLIFSSKKSNPSVGSEVTSFNLIPNLKSALMSRGSNLPSHEMISLFPKEISESWRCKCHYWLSISILSSILWKRFFLQWVNTLEI